MHLNKEDKNLCETLFKVFFSFSVVDIANVILSKPVSGHSFLLYTEVNRHKKKRKKSKLTNESSFSIHTGLYCSQNL